ncbi:uncharacterized protein LOC144623471 [Crassostrea virginica]
MYFQVDMSRNTYTPALLQNLNIHGGNLERDDVIAIYYHAGYTVREIIGFLATRHGITVIERQMHRILREKQLRRRGNQSSPEEIVRAILQELAGSSKNMGYRLMRRKLLIDHDVIASSETVRLALSALDAEGVLARSRRCLYRRAYINKGTNFAIHIDGWDKLKPFGISVHGAIDGYSRRILWLRACNSNKNPLYVARFYLDYLKEINGVPMIIYVDRGTENSVTRDIQYALRWNHADPFQGISSFIYGSSNRNTRIERFWRNMREMAGNTWINHFKHMADYGIIDTSDIVHIECIRYCFLQLIDSELDGVARHWNEHRIRKCKNVDLPAGKPDVLYFQPETFLARDYQMPLNGRLVAIERQYGQNPPVRCVSNEFEELAWHMIRQNYLAYPPTTRDEATNLFVQLTNLITAVH